MIAQPQLWLLLTAAGALSVLTACGCEKDKPKGPTPAASAPQAKAAYCQPRLLPATPRVDWQGIRGTVTKVSPPRKDGDCRAYDVHVAPKDFSCAADFVSGDVDGSVGPVAAKPQSIRLLLPSKVKLPLAPGQDVCAMYEWVDEGAHRIWDSALVARDGKLLMLALENGALEVGGFRVKNGIADHADPSAEYYRMIADHPGGSTELRPKKPVTKRLAGSRYFLVSDAFQLRLPAPDQRARGFSFAAIRLDP